MFVTSHKRSSLFTYFTHIHTTVWYTANKSSLLFWLAFYLKIEIDKDDFIHLWREIGLSQQWYCSGAGPEDI